jgi:hypothetical protein
MVTRHGAPRCSLRRPVAEGAAQLRSDARRAHVTRSSATRRRLPPRPPSLHDPLHSTTPSLHDPFTPRPLHSTTPSLHDPLREPEIVGNTHDLGSARPPILAQNRAPQSGAIVGSTHDCGGRSRASRTHSSVTASHALARCAVARRSGRDGQGATVRARRSRVIGRGAGRRARCSGARGRPRRRRLRRGARAA